MSPISRLPLTFIATVVCLAFCLNAQSAPIASSNIDSVDPFIGTAGDGNVYPGVTLPFGFIQVSPDTGPGSGAGGYKHDKNIDGFSQQHISGMGGPLYGEVSLLPMTGPLANPSSLTSTGKSAEAASPGYYTVTLAPWDVKVELTATRHVALHKTTFPANEQSRIVIDAGHCLYGTGANWGSAKPIGGEVKIDAAQHEVSGYMVYSGARGGSKRTWKVYFAAQVDTPFESFGTWDDTGALSDGSTQGQGNEIGAYLNFKTTSGQVIQARVAVSFRSVEQARGYFAKEEPGYDFAQAQQQARAAWITALDKINVEGGTAAQRTQFYTAFYHLHVTPNDWTGEAPERYADATYYENILCMWDTFRTVNPLLTLIEPKIQADIVNSIIGYYTHDGWTGDAHSAHSYEHVQNGSNADVILADAYVKKLPGIDWKLAYAAMRKNAFVDQNPKAASRPDRGRFRLDDYRQFHYLPSDAVTPTDLAQNRDIQGVSRTLEYVYDDFCVLTLAQELGTAEDIADLKSRLLWYQNVWDKESGFMRGKNKDSSWFEPFDPTKTETGPEYYEGHAWTWSWYVPHDVQGLIQLLGGPVPFVEKLRTACEKYYQAFNEPCMLETFLFIHAGRPDQTQFFVRKALANFTTAPDGLPGNDDSGTTSSWLLWAMLGIFPNAGQDFYYIGSPTFTQATLQLGHGKQFVIKAPQASAENLYIQSATLNGKPWPQAWLRHGDLINGGELVLQMGAKPSTWGALVLPPSISPTPALP